MERTSLIFAVRYSVHVPRHDGIRATVMQVMGLILHIDADTVLKLSVITQDCCFLCFHRHRRARLIRLSIRGKLQRAWDLSGNRVSSTFPVHHSIAICKACAYAGHQVGARGKPPTLSTSRFARTPNLIPNSGKTHTHIGLVQLPTQTPRTYKLGLGHSSTAFFRWAMELLSAAYALQAEEQRRHLPQSRFGALSGAGTTRGWPSRFVREFVLLSLRMSSCILDSSRSA